MRREIVAIVIILLCAADCCAQVVFWNVDFHCGILLSMLFYVNSGLIMLERWCQSCKIPPSSHGGRVFGRIDADFYTFFM